jgi:hypothetical protein
MNAVKDFALSAGIPVLKRPDGTEYVKVSAETARYLMSEHKPIEAPLTCNCDQRPYAHDLSVHRKVFEAPGTYESYEVRIRFAAEEMRWPWSLRFVMNEEAEWAKV